MKDLPHECPDCGLPCICDALDGACPGCLPGKPGARDHGAWEDWVLANMERGE